MRIAAIQMTSTPDIDQNMNEAYRLFRDAIDRGSDLVAFPENFSILAPENRIERGEAETLRGVTVQTLLEWAAEFEVWILAGSIPLQSKKDSDRVTNTSLLISDEGKIESRYDKIHLFDATVSGDQTYRESQSVIPGKKVVTAETPWAKIGMSICYDLRFPELYRKQLKNGAEILFIPSAFTKKTGAAHWDTLTRARAIENLCYVVAPAQSGVHFPGRETFGHTRIIDPWGRVIAERPAGPGVVWAKIDFNHLKRIRSEFSADFSRVKLK